MFFDGNDEDDNRIRDNNEAAFNNEDDGNNEYTKRQAKDIRRIKGNDPTLTELVVGHIMPDEEMDNKDFTNFDYLVPGGDWEGFGRAIGRNMTLKEVSFINIGRDNSDQSTTMSWVTTVTGLPGDFLGTSWDFLGTSWKYSHLLLASPT